MRLSQAHCQENKRKVPESPLLTACKGGLTEYATPWSPETGPPCWKSFLLPAILRPRFWGQFLSPFLAPRKSKQELLDGPDSPDFVHLLAPAFLLQCKPPWTHFPGPQEAMLTSCALAACRLYNASVRKLFCVHLGRSVWRALVAVHPVRALWNIL